MADERKMYVELFEQARRARAEARQLCRIARVQREFLSQQDSMTLAQRHVAIEERRCRLYTSDKLPDPTVAHAR